MIWRIVTPLLKVAQVAVGFGRGVPTPDHERKRQMAAIHYHRTPSRKKRRAA